MTRREYEGRSAAEAAIKACEDLGVTRADLRYEVVSESGEGLTDRRVVISVEVDPSQPRTLETDDGADTRSSYESRPPRARRERRDRRDRGSRRPASGSRRRGRGPSRRDGDRTRPRRPRADNNIEDLLNLEAVADEPRAETPEVEGEISARATAGREILQEIVDLLCFDVQVRLVGDGPDEIRIELAGEDEARVIGQRGEALLALQFLANRILSRRAEGDQHLVLDAADYRNRRRSALSALARQLAERAMDEGKVVRLSPMSAHDRRIFHITLEEQEGVKTRSEGDGLYRPLLIIPTEG